MSDSDSFKRLYTHYASKFLNPKDINGKSVDDYIKSLTITGIIKLRIDPSLETDKDDVKYFLGYDYTINDVKYKILLDNKIRVPDGWEDIVQDFQYSRSISQPRPPIILPIKPGRYIVLDHMYIRIMDFVSVDDGHSAANGPSAVISDIFKEVNLDNLAKVENSRLGFYVINYKMGVPIEFISGAPVDVIYDQYGYVFKVIDDFPGNEHSYSRQGPLATGRQTYETKGVDFWVDDKGYLIGPYITPLARGTFMPGKVKYVNVSYFNKPLQYDNQGLLAASTGMATVTSPNNHEMLFYMDLGLKDMSIIRGNYDLGIILYIDGVICEKDIWYRKTIEVIDGVVGVIDYPPIYRLILEYFNILDKYHFIKNAIGDSKFSIYNTIDNNFFRRYADYIKGVFAIK